MKPSTLFEAAQEEDPAYVQFFLETEEPGYVNLGDDHRTGETALHIATYWHRLDTMRALLSWGAHPNRRDRRGQTPIFRTRHHWQRSDTNLPFTLLREHGATVNTVDAQGTSPLGQAIEYGDIEAVRGLLQAGAWPHLARHPRPRPLEEAEGKNDNASVDLLVQFGAIEMRTPREGEGDETLVHVVALYEDANGEHYDSYSELDLGVHADRLYTPYEGEQVVNHLSALADIDWPGIGFDTRPGPPRNAWFMQNDEEERKVMRP